eukprot:scaffold964_cov261-Pinguiococcus_pyrenoidosus.AAC.7
MPACTTHFDKALRSAKCCQGPLSRTFFWRDPYFDSPLAAPFASYSGVLNSQPLPIWILRRLRGLRTRSGQVAPVAAEHREEPSQLRPTPFFA